MNSRPSVFAVRRRTVFVGFLSGAALSGLGCGTALAEPEAELAPEQLIEAASPPSVDAFDLEFVDLINPADLLDSVEPAPSLQASDLLPAAEPLVAQFEPEIERQQDVQRSEDLSVPPGQGETITAIELRYVDRDGQPVTGRTQPHIITREFDLQPGDRYDPALAKAGLERIVTLTAVRDASIRLEPGEDSTQAVMVVLLREASSIAIYPSNDVARPSVLRGITLPEPVPTVPLRLSGIQIPGSLQVRNIGGIDQSLTLGLLVGDQADGFDLTFANPWIAGTNHLGYAVNFQGIGYLNPVFNSGDEVELPTGNTDFWEQRIGGGFQIIQQPRPQLAWAAGLSYQVVSMREALTGSRLFTRDRDGNRLLLSDDGTDSLLTFNATLNYNTRNDVTFPTQGSHFQLGFDQTIPTGDASILYSRPTFNLSQFLPLRFITVDETPSTLVFNLQGGTLLGDAPPYEAFALGGSSSVRGYGLGALGNPQSYLQTTLEYRAPFAGLDIKPLLLQEVLGNRVLLAASAFVDYATGFGTQTFVTGQPGVVRGKPGDGFGVGLGLMATSNVGLVRLETGLSDQGDFAVYFTIGNRF